MTAAQSARARPMQLRNTSKIRAGRFPPKCASSVEVIARPEERRWWSPRTAAALGVIELKDIVKGGIKERFDQLARDGNQDGDDHRR